MNKEFIQKWIEELKSGKYKKGKGALRSRSDKFCCLGVACGMLEPSGWKVFNGHSWHSGKMGSLSLEQLEKIGISDEIQDQLIGLNDSNETFDEVINYLELLVA